MKRIWDHPAKSKNYSEWVGANWEVIPRSWNNEWDDWFPINKDYLHLYSEKDRFNYAKIKFTKCTQWIYSWTIVFKYISKWGKANNKIFCYDKVTWADFSLDIESMWELLTAQTENKVKVTKNKDWDIEIEGEFIMRWHFLQPYNSIVDAKQKEKEEKASQKLKASQYIDWKLYKDKDWNDNYYDSKWITIYRLNISTSIYKYRNHKEIREDTDVWNTMCDYWYVSNKWKTWAYWLSDKQISLDEFLKYKNDESINDLNRNIERNFSNLWLTIRSTKEFTNEQIKYYSSIVPDNYSISK